MSGLTVGYLSIDTLILELKLKNGTDEEKKNATELLSILENQHHLLVTLLVANAGAMEALPLCLNLLVSEVGAVIISVTAVLIFGEVIPQAICTGPNQLKIAATVAPITKTLMMLESIIALPVGKLLDIVLGEHGKSRYHNADLKALIELHSENALKDVFEEGEAEENVGLSAAQTRLINGTIDLIKIQAKDAMTPLEKVAMFSDEEIIDISFMKKIQDLGYSRFPIYRGKNQRDIIGMLLTKKLVGIAPAGQRLRDLGIPLRKPLLASPSICLTDLLAEFQKGKSHMALVTPDVDIIQSFKCDNNDRNSVLINISMFEKNSIKSYEILGVVTLENIIEKALGGYFF